MTESQILPYASAILLPTLGTAVWNWVPTRKQTRGNTFFGARVAADFPDSSAAVEILKQYRRRLWTWMLAGAALAILGIALVPQTPPVVFSVSPTQDRVICTGDCDGSLHMHRQMIVHGAVIGSALWGMLSTSIAFSLGHRRTRREATAPVERTIRMASLALEDEPESRWVGCVGWLAMLVPPAAPVATLVFLAIHWHQAAPFFSRSYNLFTAIYGLVLGLCFGTANQWALRFRARSSDWAPTPAASHKYRTYLGATLAFVFGFIIWQLCSSILMSFSGTVAWLRPFHSTSHAQFFLPFLFPLAAWAMVLWLKKHLATESGDPMADRYWKWGYFYFNPEDSALVVPARSGIGFSHNYAHRSVWWVGGAVVLVTMIGLVNSFRL